MATSTLTKVTYERILIPTDFSDISDRAVGYAKLIAKQAELATAARACKPSAQPDYAARSSLDRPGSRSSADRRAAGAKWSRFAV